MIRNSSKKPPKTQDPELNRILSKVYDDINALASSVNQEYDEGLPAQSGDIKVVGGIFSYHTGKKWKAIDIDKVNRTLFAEGDGGEGSIGAGEEDDGVDLTPLQSQITAIALTLNDLLNEPPFIWTDAKPTNRSSSGKRGDMYWDDTSSGPGYGYLYICVSLNTWVKCSLPNTTAGFPA